MLRTNEDQDEAEDQDEDLARRAITGSEDKNRMLREDRGLHQGLGHREYR